MSIKLLRLCIHLTFGANLTSKPLRDTICSVEGKEEGGGMSQEVAIQTAEVVPSFLKKTHELNGLLKKLRKVSNDAVDLLESIMNDPKNDVKLRKECALVLISNRREVELQVSNDEMRRLVAEIKIKPGGLTKTLQLKDSGLDSPLLDFDTIHTD